MIDIAKLGWDKNTFGELNHQKVKAPYVRLQSAKEGKNGDVIYQFDLRISQPNHSFLSNTEMHSLEHLLLKGFRDLDQNHFLCVAPMGCQTGFYLLMLNEGRANVIFDLYEKILQNILISVQVPYANDMECGHASNHSIEKSINLAKKLIHQKTEWKTVL